MTPEIRQQIFALAAQDVPRRQIAARLGISEGSVRYQLDRPAKPAPDAGPMAPPAAAALPGLPDPLAEARRSFQLEQLATSELDLRARRLEAERRLEMLRQAPQGDNGAMLLVLDGLRSLRAELESLKSRSATAPAQQAPGLFDQLTQLRQGWEAVQTIGGDQKLPSSETELSVRVALDRLNMEREERQRKLDFELDERRRQLDNERIRAEAIAEQIRQWGPILAQGAQQWLGQQGSGSPAAVGGEGAAAGVAALAPSRPGPLSVLPDRPMAAQELGQVEGPCPSCGVQLRIRPTPGGVESCPNCQTRLAVVEGKIWPRLPGASGNAIGSVAG